MGDHRFQESIRWRLSRHQLYEISHVFAIKTSQIHTLKIGVLGQLTKSQRQPVVPRQRLSAIGTDDEDLCLGEFPETKIRATTGGSLVFVLDKPPFKMSYLIFQLYSE